ncbi:hypothetical protein C7B62_20970 [Pleurocapsa sp. CCALA 161]|uniref:hypothetical protein n=1 Tax=Pleurocapsa sp. CCALA 161 TaxID=2107688 RepID=UPI000D085210|nr:hypothetical protein [Pleurocapsa sp. CCALA 161]PSB07080.1 hypothetical protein C7B62_20970 [Pleurocapsa sp. CCALA 161]
MNLLFCSLTNSTLNRSAKDFRFKIGSSFDIDEIPDVVDLLLREKRSPNTRQEYKKDINKFFQAIANKQPNRDLVWEFLHLEQQKAVQLVLSYKAQLIEKAIVLNVKLNLSF